MIEQMSEIIARSPNSIDFNKKDRAKRYHKFSIFTIQFSL